MSDLKGRTVIPAPPWISCVLACCASMLAVAAVFMTHSIFPEISVHFEVPLTRTRLAFSLTSSGYALSFFLFGPVADRFNPRKMASLGLLAIGIFVLAASELSGFTGFIISMGLIGMGASSVPAAMFPYVATIAPEGSGGTYMGWVVAASTVGVVLGRFAMGLMTAGWGWVFAFKLTAVALLLLSGVMFKFLAPLPQRYDVNNGTLRELYSNALRLLLEPETVSLLAAGFFLFFGFLGSITFLTFMLNGPPFFLTADAIGWISLAGLTALVAPFSGALSQRAGIYRIILTGLLTCLAALQFMGWCLSLTWVTCGVLLLFTGVYCSQPLIFLLINRCVPRHRLGSASSMYLLFCISGGSIASFALGPVWERFAWPGVIVACTLALIAAMLLISFNAVAKLLKNRHSQALRHP